MLIRMKWHNLSNTVLAENKWYPALCVILTSLNHLVILISKIPMKQEQVSDIISKASLCIGRTRLSSVHKAVCWLITKSLSLFASLSLINQDPKTHLPWPITYETVNTACHHPLCFFMINWILSKTEFLGGVITFFGMIWKKVATVIWKVISLWFLDRGKKEICSPHLLSYTRINIRQYTYTQHILQLTVSSFGTEILKKSSNIQSGNIHKQAHSI